MRQLFLRARFATDPWIENGMLAITTICPWTILLDATQLSEPATSAGS
jgi:hypothetical protein